MKIEGRYRPTELRELLSGTRDAIRQTRRRYSLGCTASLVLTLVLFVTTLALIRDVFVAGFVALFVVIVAGVFLGTRLQGLDDQLGKLAFAIGLLDHLFEDLHPFRKSSYRLDLTPYDTTAKRYWTGRSQHGNAKHRYEDRWLRHRFQLIEGTTVVVERRRDVKVKKGVIQKQKKRLYLKVQPNPASFGRVGDTAGLEALVRQRVDEVFHDPPERIRVDPRVEDDGLRVRISQRDAPIRAAEAFRMVETVLLYLRLR